MFWTDPGGHSPVSKLVENLVGFAAPVVGLITSLQEQIEWGFRMLSLLIGIIIGLIHLYRLLRK